MGRYWLPTVRSVHGISVDSVFFWIFCIAVVVFFLVQGTLLAFLFKYRGRAGRKAHFTHGNTRVELIWTAIPTLIFLALALGSKRIWDQYRYSPIAEDPNRAKVLVIGQQFKWNVVYPGLDGKFGKYLVYPKPTDPRWPMDKDGKSVRVAGVAGPASLPYRQAIAAIGTYIDQYNPLGKDFSDLDGKDDDYTSALGRPVIVPVGRPIEIQVASKDVIHDFFLPNYRVKLDAVPGMIGHLYLEATTTSAERARATARPVELTDLETLVSQPGGKDLTIQIDENSPGTTENKNRDARGWRYINPESPRTSIIRSGSGFQIDPEGRKVQIEALKSIGLSEVLMSDSGAWEVVCEELCGQGHNTMTALFIVVSQQEYDAKQWDKPSATTRPATTTAPTP